MLANLNDVLMKAQRECYAVGLFNTTDLDLCQAVLSAAEDMRSPVIIGTAQVLLPYGELKLIAPSLRAAAERARVPVVLHFDHGTTFNRCMEALQLGFTSIMYDGSAGDAAHNMEETAQVVRIAHAMGVTVEGEIGHVGQAADGDEAADDMYTTPEEAAAFVRATGVDALAVAIGTAHGAYKTKPRLDIGRLAQIRAALDTPLVLHGGSGLTDEDFRSTIQNGVAKINIFTDLCQAGVRGMQAGLDAGMDYLDLRNRKVDQVYQTVCRRIQVFGSQGKA